MTLLKRRDEAGERISAPVAAGADDPLCCLCSLAASADAALGVKKEEEAVSEGVRTAPPLGLPLIRWASACE